MIPIGVLTLIVYVDARVHASRRGSHQGQEGQSTYAMLLLLLLLSLLAACCLLLLLLLLLLQIAPGSPVDPAYAAEITNPSCIITLSVCTNATAHGNTYDIHWNDSQTLKNLHHHNHCNRAGVTSVLP